MDNFIPPHLYRPMKLMFTFLSLFVLFGQLTAQVPYFQQEVNYRIKGTLDDQAHTFTGSIEMDYINNSPDTLSFIYLHLWANGFKDRNTAFARQKVRQGSGSFYFAEDKDLGNYSELQFTVDGQPAIHKLQKDNPDIAVLTLPKVLKSGERITIKSPLVLKIPASFSRLGHVGESYQMTQWYPKPAVYDREGWHPMPYLDMGEYYSEFGSFDVQITLPKNYIVAATGVLQTESEIEFLNGEIEKSNQLLRDSLPRNTQIPPSDSLYKTIRFTAEKVHDFAWFADKRFYVQKDEVTLASGKKVDTWTYFTNAEGELWKKGIDYVNRATLFYSEKVGEYPYPHATAVQSALSAGGGMEYPMITVIGLMGAAQPLDEVITHEVGHNWFYGILGFDERKHGWLDEGINSYYDHRYTETYYGDNGVDLLPEFIMKKTDYNVRELAYLYQARRNLDQAPGLDSDDFSRINYFLGIYEKPAVVFKYLEKYLGTDRFDKIMQSFYREWEFKHPGPIDFRDHFVKESGEELKWFFDGFIYSNEKFDYALTGIKKINGVDSLKVVVTNKGGIDAPFTISGIKDSVVVKTKWYSGFMKKQELTFPGVAYDELVIDKEMNAPDLYRQDNTRRVDGFLGGLDPIKFQFPFALEKASATTVGVTPLISWNNYDKTMLGLALYNSPMPAKRFEYVLAPMFSFVTKDVNGTANLQYHLYPGNTFAKQVTFELGLKRFNATYNWPNEYYLQYNKITPKLNIKLASKPNGSFSHNLQYRAVILNEERPEFSRDSIDAGQYVGNVPLNSVIHELTYSGANRKAVNPWSYKLALEQQTYDNAFGESENYLKVSAEYNTEYTYDKGGKSVNLRLFFGGFLNNSRRNAGNFYDNVSNRSTRGTFGLTYQGFLDDKYDHYYFGRNEDQGIWSQQIEMKDGGMKNAFGSSFGIGLSNSYIISANLKADLPQALPLNLPLKPYFDIGFFKNATPIGSGATVDDQVLWSGGVLLEWFDGNLAVYFPIANSSNMKNLYGERGGYLSRITYTINLNAANPFELINNISF